MAKAPKANDPAKAAIDAVEDALKLDFGGPEDDLKATALDDDDLDIDIDIDEPPVTTPRDKAKIARSAKADAANDDRRAVGNIVYNIRRKPSSAPFWSAFIISLFWLGGAAFLGNYYYGDQITSLESLQTLLQLPSAVALCVAAFVPIIFFWIMATLIWRSQEMKLAANSMSEVALRLAEPEEIASDSIVTVGQAVRREVAAMGDGVERVLARASELEVLVHNEMMSLERSYSDNELRIRGLIDELSSQREAIVSSAERVNTSLTTVQEDFGQTILEINEKVVADLQQLSH